MIKVLVVDDEYFAREGMKRTVNWKELSCELCGEAEDAFQAINLSKELKPDIIITDINMPGMDGLSMAEKIKEFLPSCKFIIITGFDEFEYAKRAVKINAVDFLLKPIDQDEFIKSIKSAVTNLNNVKKQKYIAKEKILLDMMRGKISSDEQIKETLRNFNLDLQNCFIALLENDDYEFMMEQGNEKTVFECNEKITHIIKGYITNALVIECHKHRIGIIISSKENKNVEEIINRKLRCIQNSILESCHITVTFGVSNIHPILNIAKTYIESKASLKNKLYLGRGSITYFCNISKSESYTDELLLSAQEEILNLLKAKDKGKLEVALKKLYFGIFKSYKIENDIIKQVSIEIILKALNMLKYYNIDSGNVSDKNLKIYRSMSKLNTIDELHGFVKTQVVDSLNTIKEIDIEVQETGIETAIEFIKQHYTEDISLKTVAKHVYLSESYLSRKIKKVLGIGFSEYVTKLKIEKAIEYLNKSNLKIIEIASKLGYSDYRYFSHTFKKYTGYTPSEYTKIKD